ncbi:MULTISPECIES: hypothetical protein [unclassified Pseudomonas]|uniref:hypothetical protein n=1 Tax=unclassified Pseudomonas TaxID=196821 RepID=UPI0008765017|nr:MULTISPECIES: hypothetical protein [unclassified Pseudomonas]SCZ56003.1 hypothetical protein SAMN03159460_00850 [Pseudomonas sp. NFPP17]SDA46244.1 hypothetical protein SAMN03159464_01032 [Pseudomonas sp. NFPP15]SEK24173.1 hypothetical protein SAMN03159324_00355 [Pseudomonas sp. NFPP18]SFA45855.1 hypothetical protein SAMN03159320_00850 [Pseudomonas sp. NFPP13]SFT50293.1 hypothetical protein SAMN03159492_01030 [Pseudomonas sp. NFPP25]
MLMFKCIKRLFSRNAPAQPQPQDIPAPAAPPTLEEYLSGLPTCNHEPDEDFYYRTEAADQWTRYFSSEFTIPCRNQGGGHSQDLTMNEALKNYAAVHGLVYVFYYYSPFPYAQTKIASHHKECIEAASGLISPYKHWMLLCFLARYKKDTAALTGRTSFADGTQNDQECRYIICDPPCLTIPRQDIQLHLNGHWYSLPAITDLTLGQLMVTWRDDATFCASRAASLPLAVKV